jgi:hypothetical protein
LLAPSIRSSGAIAGSAQGAKPRFAKPRFDPAVDDIRAPIAARRPTAHHRDTLKHFHKV